jgi:2-methylisocitrate lyase-like PEP mutase family enzyme
VIRVGRVSVSAETDGGFGGIDRLARTFAIFIQVGLDVCCNRDKSFPKDEQVIRKNEMVNWRAISGYPESFLSSHFSPL